MERRLEDHPWDGLMAEGVDTGPYLKHFGGRPVRGE